uniref:Zinc transporter ZIP8 n=1 Tax=Syphacia muris TaxID=451379 RepID=A0A0N5ADX6_9BILA
MIVETELNSVLQHLLMFIVYLIDKYKKIVIVSVWGVGILMVAIISFSSTLGILLLPFLSPIFYEYILTFFVTLGVGTLSGSAIFHLIPEAFELQNYIPNYLHKAAMIVAGVYLFHIVDKTLTIICDFKEVSFLITFLQRSSIQPNSNQSSNKKNFTESPLAVQERKESISSHKSHISPVAWLVIFGDGLHNFIDGLSIGAAFNESFWDGISISVAVLCEELPHELGDCAILINSGMSNKKALIYNLLSASTCFIGYVIGVLVGEMDRNFGQFIFALAGGMFLYISLAGMVLFANYQNMVFISIYSIAFQLPELGEKAEKLLKNNFRRGFGVIVLQFCGLTIGIVIMYLFAEYGSLIKF